MEKNIYIIHENDEWLVPLRESFKKIKAPFKEWHMDKESFDFKKSPPNGIFYNRMSASAHSRGCLLYTSPSPRDGLLSRMPSSA